MFAASEGLLGASRLECTAAVGLQLLCSRQHRLPAHFRQHERSKVPVSCESPINTSVATHTLLVGPRCLSLVTCGGWQEQLLALKLDVPASTLDELLY